METERWIFGFRRVGRRELTEDELATLRARGRTANDIRLLRGACSVILFFGGLSGIAFAASGASWGWWLLAAGIVAFFWSLSWANQAELYGLLCRRSARIGVVDQYSREGAPESVRAINQREEDEGSVSNSHDYWALEEQFEETIAKKAGHRPATIETPIDDDVILTLDGVIINVVITAPVVTVGP